MSSKHLKTCFAAFQCGSVGSLGSLPNLLKSLSMQCVCFTTHPSLRSSTSAPRVQRVFLSSLSLRVSCLARSSASLSGMDCCPESKSHRCGSTSAECRCPVHKCERKGQHMILENEFKSSGMKFSGVRCAQSPSISQHFTAAFSPHKNVLSSQLDC